MVCGIASMARRFVNVTWNNAAVVKKPKPVEPLHYRINPLDKKFDALDKLERELEKAADKMCPERYHELYDSLQAQRERLEERRQRALGNGTTKVKTAPQAALVRPQRHRPRANVSPFALKVLAICIAVILFKIVA